MDAESARRESASRGRWVALVAVAALCGLLWFLRTKAPRARDGVLAPVTQPAPTTPPRPLQPAVARAPELVEGPEVAERSDVSVETQASAPVEEPALDPLRVRVTDRAGQALAGARVRLLVNPHGECRRA